MTRGKTHAKKVEFIMKHKDTMSRQELSDMLGSDKTTICKIIKKEERRVKSEYFFDIDKEFKNSIYNDYSRKPQA